MEVLIALAAACGFMSASRVVAERAVQPHRLLERVFDLETQAVEANDLDGREGSVGAHQEETPGGMDHGHEGTSRPAGRHSRSRTLYWMTTRRSPYKGLLPVGDPWCLPAAT